VWPLRPFIQSVADNTPTAEGLSSPKERALSCLDWMGIESTVNWEEAHCGT
jgi:hypothetical protein